MDLKKLALRTASGIVYILIIICLILCGREGIWLMSALFAILATLEFDRISYLPQRKKLIVRIMDALACVSLVLIPTNLCVFALFLWIMATLCRLITELYANEENPLRSINTSLAGQIYIGVPLASLSAMAMALSPNLLTVDLPYIRLEYPDVLLMFIMIWLNDTGAFLAGSLFGKHKLMERISPKKTWEGFFGGVIINILLVVILYFAGVGENLLIDNIVILIIYAILVSVFATWGDLVESLIKRNLGLKDSGNIMPGHGGILDRIDSLLFVAPMTCCFVLVLMLLGL